MAVRFGSYGVALAVLHLLPGCGPATEQPAAPAQNSASPTTTAPVADGRLIVAFGDSLFAGYNLPQDQGFAPALERALAAGGTPARVFNAGVSGDTTAAGRQRLGFVLDGLERKPDLVIVGLGANDMLRGLRPSETAKNLDAILAELKRRGVPAMLTGMVASPNMGPDYAATFNAIYPELSERYNAPLYPFLMDGVITNRSLLLGDGLHPNRAGVEAIVDRVAPLVADALPDAAPATR